MCRMILATGKFCTADIVKAMVAVARGETADHEASFSEHPHGWGAVWRDISAPSGLSVMRETTSADTSLIDSGLASVQTDFLAIHIRRTTSSTTFGPQFTHPLQRPAEDWYFMHNGSQPTVHQLLGLPFSTFDSAEYFDYLIPQGTSSLEQEEVLERLRKIPEPGSNSGNAFAIRPDCAYVIHWRSPSDTWPRYFTMHETVTPDCRIICSEIVPALAPAEQWTPLPPQILLEIPI
jgi:predicted glutamine amidotransferase